MELIRPFNFNEAGFRDNPEETLRSVIKELDIAYTRLAIAINNLTADGMAGFKYNPLTTEVGWVIKLTNRTGHTSVKGELVACSTTADKEVVLQASEYDTIGVVEEAGIAEGALVNIWMIGSVCQVLAKDSTAFTHGNILAAADTDGRATNYANPGGGLPGTDNHFKECGHVMESKDAGTDVLVMCILHFN